MKLEYADKINSLLQCFHFNKEFLEWNHDYSLQLLRHGVSHLYHFAMLQGENDECTLEELRNIIISTEEGYEVCSAPGCNRRGYTGDPGTPETGS
ncbi:MAG: hypothetical protein E7L08_05220 [Klebsiella michiganensis]|nr:hypothetical protein [Klebsiella michiganensis]